MALRPIVRRGPHLLGGRLGMPPSTVHAVLVAMAVAPVPPGPGDRRPDPLRTRPPGRAHPHRRQEDGPSPRRRWLARPRPRARPAQTGPGYDYVHVAIDDHSRVASVRGPPDERGNTCARFLADALAFFAAHGVTVERV